MFHRFSVIFYLVLLSSQLSRIVSEDCTNVRTSVGQAFWQKCVKAQRLSLVWGKSLCLICIDLPWSATASQSSWEYNNHFPSSLKPYEGSICGSVSSLTWGSLAAYHLPPSFREETILNVRKWFSWFVCRVYRTSALGLWISSKTVQLTSETFLHICRDSVEGSHAITHPRDVWIWSWI